MTKIQRIKNAADLLASSSANEDIKKNMESLGFEFIDTISLKLESRGAAKLQ